MMAQKGKVYLVGAGPGDPELLTVRALRLLQTADVVLHDDLVPDAVVALSNPHALITSVGKRCGMPRITQQGIHELMIDSARRNLSVVRLKSGDPMLFGRAAEELNALREASIACEVVPGVSAVFGAAAAMQTSLTDRRTASKLVLLAGRHAKEKDRAPLWSGTLPDDATLAIYMPGREFMQMQRELLQAGIAGDTPVVIVSQAATSHQSVTSCRLAFLHEVNAGQAPLIVLVGRALESALSQNDHHAREHIAECVDDVLRS